jgi:hypothetical protein
MAADSRPPRRRLLIIANATCMGDELFREIRRRADETATDVLIVAPALTSRLRYWMSDEDAGTASAQQRLAASIEHCAAAGIPAQGALGDADPLQALDDAMRSFDPDDVIIATHPPDRSNWLENGIVAQARARFSVPITHVEVDAMHNQAHVVPTEPVDHRAPAREAHGRRDLLLLVSCLAVVVAGSLVTAVLYAADASSWLLLTWFVVCDVGVKIAVFVLLWILFQRRPRADRLNY